MAGPIFFKTYVNEDNSAILTCPHCGLQKNFLAESFKGYKHKLKVKCNCNRVFTAILEFRDRVRRKTFLKATYTNYSQENIRGIGTIIDLSVLGLAFKLSEEKKFKQGDELLLEFTLDDPHQSEIKIRVTVVNIRENVIGCAFKDSQVKFGSPLEQYVNMK